MLLGPMAYTSTIGMPPFAKILAVHASAPAGVATSAAVADTKGKVGIELQTMLSAFEELQLPAFSTNVLVKIDPAEFIEREVVIGFEVGKET